MKALSSLILLFLISSVCYKPIEALQFSSRIRQRVNRNMDLTRNIIHNNNMLRNPLYHPSIPQEEAHRQPFSMLEVPPSATTPSPASSPGATTPTSSSTASPSSPPYQPIPPSALLPPPHKIGPLGPYVKPQIVWNSGGLWWMIPEKGPHGRVWMIPRKAIPVPINKIRAAIKMPPLPPPLVFASPPQKSFPYISQNPSEDKQPSTMNIPDDTSPDGELSTFMNAFTKSK